jgi:NADH:ubiquinone oxidoreductase subunit 3 (subunit A)
VNPRVRAAIQILLLLAVVVGLVLLFPRAVRFTELAARELRYFWWVILMILLACWLIWGFGRKPRS